VFWVISVYFNIRNNLPKSGTFLLGHPVYIYICCALVVLKNKIHLITFCFELPCAFHTHYEMWIVILKKRDYFEDIAIKGRMEM